MKWLNSLDELLYEVMSWLLFFPLTLWRTVTSPIDMMAYADSQLQLPQDEQYRAGLSPPLFLALSLLVGHGFSTALGETDAIVANRNGLAGMIDDDASALVLRMIVFAAFPLLAAARLVRRRGQRLDRTSLRLPFYAQCYPVAVFALGMSIGAGLLGLSAPGFRIAGGTLFAASVLYYTALQTRWFAAKLAIGYVRAAGATLLCLIEGTALMMLTGFLLSH